MPMVSSWETTWQAVMASSAKVVVTFTQVSWPMARVVNWPSTGSLGSSGAASA